MYSDDPITGGVAPTFLALVGIIGLVVVLVTLFLMTFLSVILRNRQRESAIRELAAYVAEGSISAEDAERIQRGSNPRGQLRDVACDAGRGHGGARAQSPS